MVAQIRDSLTNSWEFQNFLKNLNFWNTNIIYYSKYKVTKEFKDYY